MMQKARSRELKVLRASVKLHCSDGSLDPINPGLAIDALSTND
jgi:hypothetical protein